MRHRLISSIKLQLQGELKSIEADIEAILEDPTGLTSPTHLIRDKLKEAAARQASLDMLAGFEEE